MASPRARWKQRTTPRDLCVTRTYLSTHERERDEHNPQLLFLFSYHVTSASLLHHGG
jgi:hypothetical protein